MVESQGLIIVFEKEQSHFLVWLSEYMQVCVVASLAMTLFLIGNLLQNFSLCNDRWV
jgi:hypothetical protein